MKTKVTLAIAAAALGVSQANALQQGAYQKDFIPIESLPVEERVRLQPDLEKLGESFDWDAFAVGVDHRGKIVLVQREKRERPIRNPSCSHPEHPKP